MTVHAVFSPSSAHRWFECPGSIRLIATLPAPPPSTAADEGTAAHALAARCLASGADAVTHLGETIAVEDRAQFVVTEAMVEGVQIYLDTVRTFVTAGYNLQVEVRLNLGHLCPNTFGTGDAVLYHPKRHHLAIVDFKYGRFVQVHPEDNPQLLSYGSGAARLVEAIELLSLIVVQPRASGQAVRQWDLTPEILRAFEVDFKQAVKEASEPDAPLCAGEWCQFCPAAAVCPEYRNLALRLAQAEFRSMNDNTPATILLPDPPALTVDELGGILSAIDLIEDWITAVKSHALKRALAGEVPTGHKLVRKNTLRRWTNEDKAAAALTRLYELDPDQIWVRKLVSPAQAEKLLDKSARAALHSLIMRPDGDATLAPLSDKRPAMVVDAKKEFDVLRENLHASVALLEHEKPGEHDGGTKSQE